MTRKKCKTCYYRKRINGAGGGLFACHYAIDTGRLRECSPENCDKYVPRRSAVVKKQLYLGNVITTKSEEQGGEKS